MGARRFGPLILLLCLGSIGICVRLFQVQVLEHDVWRDEARNLVRQGAVVPYDRGEILDAHGRQLVRDEDVYRVEFRYRDFRRGHPLGQVAHAWSSLTMRPEPLQAIWRNLEPLAVELVQLTHAELDAFADGAGLEGQLLHVPPEAPDAPEYRSGRRSDVRFYITQLLGLDRKQALRAARAKDSASLLEFAVAELKFEDGDALLDDLELRLGRARADLEELARQLELNEERMGEEALVAGGTAIERLLDRLEGWRAEVEDQTAGELFREATGFPVGRVDPVTILEHFDLRWLAMLLRWDDARTERWVRDSRDARLRSLDVWYLPRMAIELEFARRDGNPAATLAREWRALFIGAGDSRPIVFEELDSLFALRIKRSLRAADLEVLPLAAATEVADFEDLAALELWRPDVPVPDPEAVELAASEWGEHLGEEYDRDWVSERSRELIERWDGWFQATLVEHLATLDSIEPETPLRVAEGRLDRADERARSVLKDRGSRSHDVARRPDYDLIHLLTRYPEHFAGTVVRDSTERLRAKDDRGVQIAGSLIGTVRTQGLREVLGQREQAAELEELFHAGTRNEEQEQELERLLREVARLDEFTGGDGLEGYYDAELRGHNGYREKRGLQQLADGGASGDLLDLRPINGAELHLTLDTALQRAAIDALEHPGEEPNTDERDYNWLRNPTGAIVICRVNGDVLAAASFPDTDREPAGGLPHRHMALERTLRMPGFQPPGSVFKPFVAAWALEHRGLDPEVQMTCGPLIGREGSGYSDLICHARWGHGEVDLHLALERSCNGYFAWVGEQFEVSDFIGLAAEFGFGAPTGVRPDRSRGGLYEEYHPRLFKDLRWRRRDFLTAGNGLSVVQASPMQVARAYCGLATGVLPDMRLVDRVGEQPVERTSRPLGLSSATLATVRGALYDVTNDPDGSAYRALNRTALGLAISGKTGSADLTGRAEMATDGKLRVRKHTWFAGWFPPEDPVAVVVVFLDDTLMTSSHTSVWVAQKLLKSPEVTEFIDREVPR